MIGLFCNAIGIAPKFYRSTISSGTNQIGGKINDSSPGRHFFLPFLSAITSLLKLTRCPSRALTLASCIALQITKVQGHRQVWRTMTPSRTTDANLECAFVKTHLFSLIQKIVRLQWPCLSEPLDLDGFILPDFGCTVWTVNGTYPGGC